MEDRLSLYECIRDKISDYFMKQSYTASSDLMSIFGSILGDKMLWNLLIKGLFHHLHYIPIPQLNLINDNLSSRMSELQHQQIQRREEQLERQNIRNQSIMESNRKKLKMPADDSLNDSDDSNKSASGSQSKSTKKTDANLSLVLLFKLHTPYLSSLISLRLSILSVLTVFDVIPIH